MQSVSSRIWTRVAVSISYDDNDYTTGLGKMTSKMVESALLIIGLFSPLSQPGNTRSSKKTWTSSLEDYKKEAVRGI